MNTRERFVRKLVVLKKRHPRLRYPLIFLATVFLVFYHLGKQYLYHFKYHLIRQRAIVLFVTFLLLLSSTAWLRALTEDRNQETESNGVDAVAESDAGYDTSVEGYEIEETDIAEEPDAIEEPGVVEEPDAIEEPGVVEEPDVIEEPGVVEEPDVIEEPGVVEESDVIEEPDVVHNKGTDALTKQSKILSSDISSVQITIVGTPPNHSWIRGELTLTVSADDGSGIHEFAYSLDDGITYSDPITWDLGGDNTFTLSASGDYTDQIKVRAYDLTGHWTESESVSARLDNEGPVNVMIGGMLTDNGWLTEDFSLSLSALDAHSGVESFTYSLDAGDSYSEPIPWKASGNNVLTISDSGDYTDKIKIRVYDHVGYYAESEAVSVRLDKSPPENVALSGMPADNAWVSEDVEVIVSAGVSVSGIKEYLISTDGGNTYGEAIAWEPDGVNSFLVEKHGDYTNNIQVRVYNHAGVYTDSDGVSVRLDKTPPTNVTIHGMPANNEIVNHEVALSVSARDLESGVKGFQISYDNGVTYGAILPWNVSGDNGFVVGIGDYTDCIKVRVFNHVDSFSDSPTVSVRINQEEPIDVSISGTPSGNLWVKDDVVLTVSSSKGNDRIRDFRFSIDNGQTFSETIEWKKSGSNTFTLNETGDYTNQVRVRVTSITNAWVDSDAVSVRLDKTPPSIRVDNMPNNNVWMGKSITLSILGTDNESGIQSYQVSNDGGKTYSSVKKWKTNNTLTIKEEGDYTNKIRVVAYNHTGQSAISDAYSVRIDKTKPLVRNIAIHPSSDKDGAKQVTFEVYDDMSGISPSLVSVEPKDKMIDKLTSKRIGNGYRFSFTGKENTKYYISCMDHSGNSSIKKKAAIKKDKVTISSQISSPLSLPVYIKEETTQEVEADPIWETEPSELEEGEGGEELEKKTLEPASQAPDSQARVLDGDDGIQGDSATLPPALQDFEQNPLFIAVAVIVAALVLTSVLGLLWRFVRKKK